MKVLHVYNTAGVASVLAEYMDKLFLTESKVVVPELANPYGLPVYGEVWRCGLRKFKLKVLWEARKYDVLHCHSTLGIALWLKRLYPFKKVILHLHGSDIRGQWEMKKRYWKNVDSILVSTPDLLEGAPLKAKVLPNPIDVTYFRNCGVHKKGLAVTLGYDADDVARKLAEEKKLFLLICNGPFSYKEIPSILGSAEYYVDVKRKNGEVLKANSKTGLEALACGCKVICWDGTVLQSLPAAYLPGRIVSKLYWHYKKLLQHSLFSSVEDKLEQWEQEYNEKNEEEVSESYTVSH